jgi:signal transduction histidine kinase
MKEKVSIRPSNANLEKLLKERNIELEAFKRELEIEAALERVRSRSMAMHSTEELVDVSSVVYEELKKLGITTFQSCGFHIIDEQNEIQQVWNFHMDLKQLTRFQMPIKGNPILNARYAAWKKRKNVFYQKVGGQQLNDLLEFISDQDIKLGFSSSWIEKFGFPDPVHFHFAYFSRGYLHVIAEETMSEEHKTVLGRFAKVFEQTYTRFLDLQKAEKQTREAQIEVSLERIRTRALAMHRSEELPEVALVVWEQLGELKLADIEGCSIHVFDDEKKTFDAWFAFPDSIKDDNKMLVGTAQYKQDCIWVFREVDKQYRAGATDIFIEMNTAQTNEFIDWVGIEFPKLSKEFRRMNLERLFMIAIPFSNGIIGSHVFEPIQEESKLILKRITDVFDLAFRRFKDLQKAEAQAREAQIEAALERVRSRSMAMHKSEELGEVINEFFNQMNPMGLARWGCALWLADESVPKFDVLFTSPVDQKTPLSNEVPVLDRPIIRDIWTGYKNQMAHLNIELIDEKKEDFDCWFLEETGMRALPDEVKQEIKSHNYVQFTFVAMRFGLLGAVDISPIKNEQIEIVRRFANVFQQTYTRFIDIQKAETQAREAEIQLALERVRARTMAMHRSDELREVVSVLYEQMIPLGLAALGCELILCDEENEQLQYWSAVPEQARLPECYPIPKKIHPFFQKVWKAWKKRTPRLVVTLKGQEKRKFDKLIFEKTAFKNFPESAKNAIRNGKVDVFSLVTMKYGLLEAADVIPLPEHKFLILERFAKVFEQTYTRFLDLQKAEAQAREAQIEAALERVRARAMAMHKSDELLNVITVVSEQLQLLNFKFDNVSFAINNQQYEYNFWLSSAGQPFPYYIHVPYIDNPMFERVRDVQKNGVKFYSDTLTKEENKQWIQHLLDHNNVEFLSEETRIFLLNSGFARSIAIMPNIMLIIGNYASNPYSEKENDIIKRFGQVFEQSYTRFLDLQKAEAQAREAQIEASLERVRSRSMAMQKSQEINIILAKVFEELTLLELEFERCVIWTYNPENKSVRWWAANPEAESGTESFLITNQDHPVYLEYWKAWEERRAKYLYILEGDNMVSWCDVLFDETELGRLPQEVQVGMREPDKVYLYNTFNDFGVLFLACLEPLSDDKFSILERFGKVFDQSYTRFNDIKQAENREKEAVKQSSLDRVRAEIASMRTTQDLERITPLIWKELTTLGVPFIRCGVFIMKENLHVIHAYLSAPDGHSLGLFDLPYDSKEIAVNALKHWRKNRIYKDHWNKDQFIEFMQKLVQSGQIENPKSFLGASAPPESLYLNFLPFKQGMLYVGNTEALLEDELQLIQSLANAFSVAYARYEDFNELENAKNKVEVTLNKLKSAQSQLIHSEKMASLGELTAGIAHEIQNPLNFVNNFSEVSEELVIELKEELEKGDLEEAKGISEDVIENLKKIHHHGKRASGIVKGMLQHSRTSTGERELTDINVLADEYIRLAYHGFRAKDKSFNAEYNLDLDEKLPKIKVIPQDIGRVLLNLINNAFYAVSKKAKENIEGYMPMVEVNTKSYDDRIEIKVKDNGSGIQDKEKDKIFQPFFTTKPTGQGTGLGLSLSYDIIKAHSGEIRIETKSGESSVNNSPVETGTQFIIEIPLAT